MWWTSSWGEAGSSALVIQKSGRQAMEEDIVDKMQRFLLSIEEVEGVQLEEIDMEASKEVCGQSLARKIYGEKRVSFVGSRNTITAIWLTKEPFKVKELGFNLFQFVFSNQEDKKKVAQGKAWTFEQQYLLLKDWKEGMNIQKESFAEVDLWVQI